MIGRFTALLVIPALTLSCDSSPVPDALAGATVTDATPLEVAGPRFRRVASRSPDYASPSPDGRSVVFTDWSTGDIAMMDLVSGQSRRITDKGTWEENGSWGEEPIFSDDGRQVVFWYGNVEGGEPFRAEIRAASVSGGEMEVLYQFADEEEWAQPLDWASPGILLELYREEDPSGLALLPQAGGDPRVLHEYDITDWATHVHEAVFSPGADWVAYRLRSGRIRLVRPDGSANTLLDATADALLGWDAGASDLIVHASVAGSKGIWSVPVRDGEQAGEPTLLRSGPPALTPAGQAGDRFFYTVPVDAPRLFEASIDLEAGRMLTAPVPLTSILDGWAIEPAWSRDGAFLAYVQRGETHRIMVRSVRDGEVVEVMSVVDVDEAQGVFRLVWDATGRWLYYVVDPATEPGRVLERVEVETGERERVMTIDGVQDALPIPDRGKVLLSRARAGSGEQAEAGLFLHDIRSGESERISERGAQVVSTSPDGEWIAWIDRPDPETRALMVRSMDGGKSITLATRKDPEGFLMMRAQLPWSSDSETVFAGTLEVRDPGAQGVLTAFPIKGGEPRPLLELPSGVYHTLQAGGTRLVFVSGDPRAELWVLEGVE